MALRKVAFAFTSQIKVQARITPRTRTQEGTTREKARMECILNLDFQPLEFILNPDFQSLKHPKKKDMTMLGNRMTGLPAIGLTNP